MSSSALTPFVTDANSQADTSEYPMATTQDTRISSISNDMSVSHDIQGRLQMHSSNNNNGSSEDNHSTDARKEKRGPSCGKKRSFSEYIDDMSSQAELEILSLKKYPAFGGRCYRHSAKVYLAECDSRQRELQSSLQALSPAAQSKISSIWQAFASEPAEQRLLILQGIVNLCCIPQLSYLNNVVPQQLRVDYLAALPHDISLLILSYLDAKTLCQASQVSRTWAGLANDDRLWHRMCAQHIDKVCKKCGWGLPLLDKTSRRVYEATARRALMLATNATSSAGASRNGMELQMAGHVYGNYLVSASPVTTLPPAAMGAGGSVARLAEAMYSSALRVPDALGDSAGRLALPNIDLGYTSQQTGIGSSTQSRNMIPVSSLINPSDMEVALVSSVCAPQNADQLMQQRQQLEQRLAEDAQLSPLTSGTFQHGRSLLASTVESGNASDGGCSVNSSATGITNAHPESASSSSGSSDHKAHRRPWKEVFAERQIIANNWRKFRYHESRIPAHADGILCAQFNDEFIITGSYDSKVRVWEADSLGLVSELTGHTMPVRVVEFDDCKLFSGSLDGTVRIWNYREGTCIRTLRVFEDGGVISLHQQHGTLVVGGENGTIRVFNIAKMTSFTLTGHTDWVNTVRLYGENTLFSCSDDMLVKRWDLDQRRCVRTYAGHSHHVQSLQLSSRMPAVAGRGRDLQRGRRPLQRTSLGGISGGVTSSCETPARPFMITGSLDSTMRVWDIDTGECLDTIFGHVEGIWSMTFDALRIVSGSNDGTLKVWDTTSHSCLFTLQPTQAAINCVAISDTRIILGDNDGNARVFDFSNRHLRESEAC
ncbi:ubiquitin-binding SDF ubiquitin ligase complex subunit met30 [Coemansia sp. RSA 1939]|nr:ubiquitin-binding SDF ubiquitin ligase complex subunit met30 [Coemansia sp. RSA 1939]KAJ2615886.1 ubiquitin-binding SDF ubiquitin ligase complex subunit met30 [Coemansia sp. RSA 1804]KAJ2686479.1 ubiquitin-binding SDF ubiquitin ligase complex subunit met30 [Coemansia sp. RSA 1285]